MQYSKQLFGSFGFVEQFKKQAVDCFVVIVQHMKLIHFSNHDTPADNQHSKQNVHHPFQNGRHSNQDGVHQRLHSNNSSVRSTRLTLSALCEQLSSNESQYLWLDLVDLVIKTVITIQPQLFMSYQLCRTGKATATTSGQSKQLCQHQESVCFEILGFDVLLDRSLRPYLLKV